MDFIERVFGFSPDGGSGLFELLLFILPVLSFAAFRLVRFSERLRRRGYV
ncbi:MAG: hypothetical protein LJE95_12880 [Acidobacteria bacterium]|nr:hypothetical protein [Acidobacteriota bacterium]